jgi:hypothetical protein
MDFFIDRNVPVALARMLGHYDRNHTVIYHDDRFEKTTPDTEWMAAIAEYPSIPVVISGDGRILKNPAERQVLQGLPLTFFFLASGWPNLKWAEYAWKAIKIWPQVIQAASPPRPTVYQIPISAQKVEFVSQTASLGGRTKR